MALYIFSDAHLGSGSEELESLKLQRIEQLFEIVRCDGDRLVILGDLFEVWLGDDAMDAPDGDPLAREVADALRAVRDAGAEVLLMHGNRDFLLGDRFARVCGARLIEDPTLWALGQETCALMHGDTLCTEDHAYQKFRALARSQPFQDEFLSKPLAERRALAQAYRAKSEQVKRATPEEIMDVAPSAVEAAFRHHAATRDRDPLRRSGGARTEGRCGVGGGVFAPGDRSLWP